MILSRQLLQSGMNRLLSKLNILLQPMVESQVQKVGPLTAEIHAAAAVMRWFAAQLPASRQLFAEELRSMHRSWPNVNEWSRFVKAIESLSIDPTMVGATGADPKEVGEAMADFDQAQTQLLTEARQMKAEAPGAAAPSKASEGYFLPTDSLRRIYRDHVIAYYQEYIVGKELKHKELMVHWAAVYQAIVHHSGAPKVDFFGPEFDEFIYDYCGIAYNKSDKARGRYRTIQDVRARCLDIASPCPQREDFLRYQRAMNDIIRVQQKIVPQRGSDIPRKLSDSFPPKR